MSIKSSNYKNIQLQDIKVPVCKVEQSVIREDKKTDRQTILRHSNPHVQLQKRTPGLLSRLLRKHSVINSVSII